MKCYLKLNKLKSSTNFSTTQRHAYLLDLLSTKSTCIQGIKVDTQKKRLKVKEYVANKMLLYFTKGLPD